MQLYIKKIESVFGEIKFKRPYEDKTRSYFPTSVSYLLFKIYNLNTKSFLSKKARIPEEIFRKNWKHKLAFLLGVIIDDGHVDSTLIVIGLRNRKLAQDLQKICQLLNYKSTYTERIIEGYKEYGFLSILKDGTKKLLEDYNKLKKEYLEVHLGYKEEQIERIFRINKREIKRVPGNAKIILKMLSKVDLTVNEIAKEVFMTRQGVRYHIHKLERQKRIRKVGIKGNNNYIYSLSKSFK